MAGPRMLLHVLDPLLESRTREARFCGDRRAEFHVPEEALWWAREILVERGIGREPFAVLTPGGRPARRWPAERFARLAVLLTRHFGMHVLVEGAPEDRGLLAEVEAAVRQGQARRRIIFATDSLPVLAALFERARLLVSNDAMPIHLAEAVAVPTLYFTRCEDLTHGHPRTRACWALYDDAGGGVRNISVEQALGAVRRMVRQGLVRGLAS
jgi:ADP-heptose:LPS heptosyltransferase